MRHLKPVTTCMKVSSGPHACGGSPPTQPDSELRYPPGLALVLGVLLLGLVGPAPVWATCAVGQYPTDAGATCTACPLNTVGVSSGATGTGCTNTGRGLLLDAANEAVVIQKTAALQFGTTSSFSVSAYVKFTSVTASAFQVAMFVSDKQWNLAENSGFALMMFRPTAGTAYAMANVGSGGTARLDVTHNVAINDGAWHQVVLVFQRTANSLASTLSLYVDGVLAGSSSNGAFGSVSTGFPIVVGSDGTQAFAGAHIDTTIAEVRVGRGGGWAAT
jgi:hypothetical protein